ncbi:unnamed protein product [Rotaria magnacalcarata]|uniref:UBC core domain-containing protein n=2 Tax=Rotaria magnacalcarata TaxID=392030 RepID=A0A816AWU2_9BILA|nr:unnamed protein product [Rotaria magnacalcarata]
MATYNYDVEYEDQHPKRLIVNDYEKVQKLMNLARDEFEIPYEFVLSYDGNDLLPKHYLRDLTWNKPNCRIRVRRKSRQQLEPGRPSQQPLGRIKNAPPDGWSSREPPTKVQTSIVENCDNDRTTSRILEIYENNRARSKLVSPRILNTNLRRSSCEMPTFDARHEYAARETNINPTKEIGPVTSRHPIGEYKRGQLNLSFNKDTIANKTNTPIIKPTDTLDRHIRSDNKLNDWGQALEAQFFLHLRKYIFPPAVLALKHAITEGCLFWFENPLIVDALIQLLKDLCPANVPGHELCDCIPLFLGWLLSQCDVKAPNTDLYKTVNLITLQNSTQQLLQDPATQISLITGPYELKERTEIRGNAKRHVDIRSLTQHLLNREHYYTICYCKRTDYLIYDSTNSNEVVKKLKIDRLNDEEITKQYKLMAKDYPSLTFITRGALRADITDQLIFLLDRTVALVFKKKTDRRITTTNRTDSKTSVESFEIFNPLQTTVGRTPTITAAQVYDIRNIEDKSQALPIYFTLNTHDEQVDNSLSVVYKNEMPKQITVVLLDRSRSMFEKFASSDLHDKRTIIDMSIIMLGILSDNIISLDHTPAFGLIHFGTSLETVCPITRNQDQFEKSLKAAPAKQEWTYGIDNHSVSSFDDMKTRIKQHSITIDFISFLRDELLQNRERHIVNLIKRLCEETHGYIYQQFPLTHIQLGATFEQEAAVWLIERDTKVFGAVSKPSRQKPLQLEYNAVSKVPNRVPRLTGGVPHYHRVVSEVNDVFNSHLDFIQLFVCRKDIFFWKVIMKGPFGTPYESGLWLLYANFGEEYPRRAPTVRFMTEIYHVNINSDGKICHQIFDRGWASVTTMVDAFTSIFDLLKESNFDDALSIEKTQLKRDQPDEYHRQAIDCTRRCAHKNLHELKLQFQLED